MANVIVSRNCSKPQQPSQSKYMGTHRKREKREREGEKERERDRDRERGGSEKSDRLREKGRYNDEHLSCMHITLAFA